MNRVTRTGESPQNPHVRPLSCLTVVSPTSGRYQRGESDVTMTRPVRPFSRLAGAGADAGEVGFDGLAHLVALVQRGIDGEVARMAGVSHNAPYNHFGDRAALMPQGWPCSRRWAIFRGKRPNRRWPP